MNTQAKPIERQLEEVALRLLGEFRGVFAMDLVRDEVARAHRRSETARIHLFDAVFAYRFAREALRAKVPTMSPAGG
jgi:hypothetical protein